jgi:hypothetical protein
MIDADTSYVGKSVALQICLVVSQQAAVFSGQLRVLGRVFLGCRTSCA